MWISLDDSPTQRSRFELLASVQAIAEFEQTHVILGDLIDQMPCSSKLPECELVVVFVVEYIHEGCKKRVQVLRKGVRKCGRTKLRTYIKDRELGENSTKLLIKRVLREFNLAHIEIAYTANLEIFVDYLGYCQLLDLNMIDEECSGIQLVFFAGSWIGRCPKNLPLWALVLLPLTHSSTS